MNEIVAIDFDGTVVTHEYPEVGREVENCVNVLKHLQDEGVKIILWTMRHGKELQDAVDWYAERDIRLWGININPEQYLWTQSPKCYAHLYIDDAALGCPVITPKNERPYVDWLEVEQLLVKHGFLSESRNAQDENLS